MLRFIKLLHRNRAGFTLIEILAAITITGIISLGAAVATGTVMNQTTHNRDYTSADRQVINALHWIACDAMMAQTVNGTGGFPQTNSLSLQWRGWDNTLYSANYTLTNGELRRVYSDGSSLATTLIATGINSAADKTNCVSGNGTLTITITATAGAGSKTVNVTKAAEVSCRPDL
jgi:prepilin-type N-terminal cleavage/methylation domain-containing protein